MPIAQVLHDYIQIPLFNSLPIHVCPYVKQVIPSIKPSSSITLPVSLFLSSDFIPGSALPVLRASPLQLQLSDIFDPPSDQQLISEL